MNYLIAEAVMVGKGANVVVSMIDHYLRETLTANSSSSPPC